MVSGRRPLIPPCGPRRANPLRVVIPYRPFRIARFRQTLRIPLRPPISPALPRLCPVRGLQEFVKPTADPPATAECDRGPTADPPGVGGADGSGSGRRAFLIREEAARYDAPLRLSRARISIWTGTRPRIGQSAHSRQASQIGEDSRLRGREPCRDGLVRRFRNIKIANRPACRDCRRPLPLSQAASPRSTSNMRSPP